MAARSWRQRLQERTGAFFGGGSAWGPCVVLALAGASCAGPDGAYLGTLDREPALRRESAPTRPRAERPLPSAAPTVREPVGAPYLSPQSISIPAAPKSYFERTQNGKELPFWVFGEGRETILVLGGQHGNERSACELVFRFLKDVAEKPALVKGRRVVIAPLVNPDGLAANTRENARGVDLNRNFPADNWRPALASEVEHRPGTYPRSEVETRFVLYLLERYRPDRVVSVHGAASCVNWDGPAEGLARSMSTISGLQAKASIGYPTPGSTGTYVGRDHKIPIITLELRSNQELGSPYPALRDTLLAAVHYPSVSPLATLD